MGEDVNCIDVTDFRFRCANKIHLFENWSNLAPPLQVVASASKFGLIFVGTPNSLLVFKTSDLLDNGEQGGQQECPRRTVPLEGIINLSVNCDDTLLMVTFIRAEMCQAFIFKVEALLTTQNIVPYGHIMLGNRAGQFLSEVAWNPTFPGYVSCCLTDGTLSMYEVKDQEMINIINTVANAEARCVSWSPKGKQLVAGSRQGLLTQYNPDLKPVKCHQVPQSLGSPAEALAICWLSSFQFAVVYKIGSPDENRLTLCIVNAPKQGPVTCIDYEDVCYTAGDLRSHQFYLYIQHTWGVLLCASANAMEVGVLGQCEGQQQPPRWQQWTTEDSARAELPMQSAMDTYPLGMAVDTSCSKPLPYGEEEVCPMPVLALLSNRGALCVFHIMNLKPSAGQVCSAPLTLPNALPQLFSIPISAASSAQQPPPVAQPAREQPPQFVQQQPIAQPIPQVPDVTAKQPVQPIVQPIPQPTKPVVQPQVQPKAVQPTVQPKAVQPSVQPKIVQPSAQVATPPTQQPQMATSIPIVKAKTPEKQEEEIPELPYETFILTLKRLNGIFKEEIAGSLSRFHDELQKVTLPTRVGDLDESFEELRKTALQLSKQLEEDTETESSVLRPLDEHQSKVYEDINANVTTKNMPGFAKLLKSRPLDAATASQLKEMEQKVLYIDSELHQVADTLATLDCRDLKKDKFGLPQKMATNRTQVYLLKVLQFLENRHKMMQKEASNDPNVMYNAESSFLGMESLSEALNAIPTLRRSPLTPHSYKVEEYLSELSDEDFLPEVDALSPVFSPIKAMSAKSKPAICDFATWRESNTAPTTPVTTRAPESPAPKTFGSFSSSQSTPPPFGAFKPPNVREEIRTPEETSAASDLASLAKLTEKAAPSFALKTLMVGQATGKPETSKAFTVPTKSTSVFGGAAVFSAPKFETVASKPSDFVASSPVSFSVVPKPSTMFGGTTGATTTTSSAAVFSATPVFGGTKTAMTTPSPVIFGGQQSSDSPIFGKSVFGATPSQSVFGGTKPTPADSAINLTATTKTATTSEVVTTTVAATTTVTTTSSLFGSTPMFGSPMFGSSTTPSPFSFSLPSSAGFGSFSATTTSATTTTPSKPLFGSSTTAATTTPPVSTVTATASSAPTTTSTLFGGTSAATPLFGGTATSTPSVFGGTAASKPSLFGNLSSTTVSSSPVFGTSTTSPTVTATPSTPLFGSGTSTPVSSSPTTTSAPASIGTVSPTVGTSSSSPVTPVTTTSTPLFGTTSSGTVTITPVLATTTASTTPVLGTSTTLAFGTTTATTTPAFGTSTATTTPAFGTTTDKTTPVFGTTATTSSPTTPTETTTVTTTPSDTATATTTVAFGTTPSFGSGSLSLGSTAFAPATTTSTAVFGSATTTATPAFGTPVFGTASTASVFGGANTSTSTPSTPVFGSASASTPSTASVFGGVSTAPSTPVAAPVFGSASATPSTSQFGSSVFGSVFGSTAATTATPTFGTPTAPSAFATNVFGQVASPQTSDSTAQVSNMFGGMMGSSSGGSMFGGSTSFAATKSPSSIFGGGQQAQTPDNSQNLFGNVQACSPSVNKNLFGASSPQQNPFSKQPASTVFGQSPGGGSFSSSQQNVFGQVTPGPFSQGGNTGPISFALSPGGSSNIFGGGAGSSFGSTSPTSGGFGAPPTFGGGPTFGGAPTFAAGSRPGMFGASSPGSSIFGGSPVAAAPTVQESSTFTALASQNTVGFGNLAQQSPQQPTGFGFGGGFAQQPQSPPNNNNQPGGSTFNTSSFSSWR